MNSNTTGHMEQDHQLGILICEVKFGAVKYKGRKYWNCEELTKNKKEE